MAQILDPVCDMIVDIDAQKAAVAKQVSEQYPENQACPPGSQGRLFGIGRCIPPGDKDYNRGTLNPGRH